MSSQGGQQAGPPQQQGQIGMMTNQVNSGQPMVISSVNSGQVMQPGPVKQEAHVITVGQNFNQSPIIINQVQMVNQNSSNAPNMQPQAAQMQMPSNAQVMQTNQMMQQRVQMPQNRSKFFL